MVLIREPCDRYCIDGSQMNDQIIFIEGETPSNARCRARLRALAEQHRQAVDSAMPITNSPKMPECLAIEPSTEVQRGPRRKRGKGNKYHRS